MRKILKKYGLDCVAILTVIGIMGVVYLSLVYDAGATDLTTDYTANYRRTSAGNLWRITADLTLHPVDLANNDIFNTGLSNVVWANVAISQGATDATIKVVRNSNDGTIGSANGWVYIAYGGGQGAVGSILAVGN